MAPTDNDYKQQVRQEALAHLRELPPLKSIDPTTRAARQRAVYQLKHTPIFTNSHLNLFDVLVLLHSYFVRRRKTIKEVNDLLHILKLIHKGDPGYAIPDTFAQFYKEIDKIALSLTRYGFTA